MISNKKTFYYDIICSVDINVIEVENILINCIINSLFKMLILFFEIYSKHSS